jgi:preprotein translocase subunit SecG
MTVLLVIHLIITVLMIGVILLQRSEGGGLGMGSSNGGVFTARGAANLLTRLTAFFAAMFIGNCLLMTVIASKQAKSQQTILDVKSDTKVEKIDKATSTKEPTTPKKS